MFGDSISKYRVFWALKWGNEKLYDQVSLVVKAPQLLFYPRTWVIDLIHEANRN